MREVLARAQQADGAEPGWVSTAEIRASLEHELTIQWIVVLLKRLTSTGEVEAKRTGRVVYWRLAEQAEDR